MRTMICVLTIAAGILTAIPLYANPATANHSIHQQVPLCLGPFCGTFVLPAGFACSFPVQIALGGEMFQTTLFNANGDPVRAIQTGQITATVTNINNNKSTFLHINGPTLLNFHADGSIDAKLLGPGLLPIPGETLVYFHGAIDVDIASGGFPFTVIKRVGHFVDICALLG